MFITPSDLRKKSDVQLAALFNEVNAAIGALSQTERKLVYFKSLNAMIVSEQASRTLRP